MAETKTKKSAKPKVQERTAAENIDKIIIDLAKQGNSPAKIGMILKKEHNIPKAKLLGKKITKILKENNVEYEDDLALVNKRIIKIDAHSKKNKQDKRADREIVKFIGLRKKLEKYKLKKG